MSIRIDIFVNAFTIKRSEADKIGGRNKLRGTDPLKPQKTHTEAVQGRRKRLIS